MELRIEDAKQEEVPAMVEMGEGMVDDSQFTQYGYDALRVKYSLEDWIDNPNLIVVNCFDGDYLMGTMIAVVSEQWFSDYKICAEIMIYVRNDYRSTMAAPMLVTAVVERAKAMDAEEMACGASTGSAPGIERLYKSLGFTNYGYCFRQNIG